jgi:HEAT repeat protein
MHEDDEFNILDSEEDLNSSLDDKEAENPPPDPEQMLAWLTSEDAPQRMIAARVFCEISDQRSIPYLIALLRDICPLVRVSAAYALGRNISLDAVESLITVLKEDLNGYVRKGVVWALGNCHDRRSVPSLIHALKTDIPAVRLWAASSLAQVAKLDYEEVIFTLPPLIEGLRGDLTAAVRSNCAWSIGQLCRELPSNVIYATAIDALIEALVEDGDLGVKEDARGALLKLGDPRGLQMIEDLEFEGLI